MKKILHLQGISSKLLRLIRMTHEDSQAKVVIEKNKTECFNVYEGVGQDYVFVSHFVQLGSGLYYKKIRYQKKYINYNCTHQRMFELCGQNI
jgi:hypothetical protein